MYSTVSSPILRFLTKEDQYKILLGEGVAKSLNLPVGSFVTVLANTPEGGLNSLEFEVVGVFRTFSKDFDARAIRLPLPDAQELLAATGVHALVIALRDSLATDATAIRLKSTLSKQGYEVKTWFELDDFYAKTVDLYKSELGVLQLIILLVVLLSVANSVNMTAYERVGEFGTLKALGKKSSDISRIIILENSLLGFFGALLGVGLGVLLAWYRTWMREQFEFDAGGNGGRAGCARLRRSNRACRNRHLRGRGPHGCGCGSRHQRDDSRDHHEDAAD